jgi:hypothetical protein
MSYTLSVKTLGMALVSILSILMVHARATAEECKAINIISGSGLMRSTVMLQSDILSVAKGGCVIWVNRASVGDIKIRFQGEKNCDSFMIALSGFKLDPDSGCYTVEKLSSGGSASLVFNSEGVYHYVVEFDIAPTRLVYGKIGVMK